MGNKTTLWKIVSTLLLSLCIISGGLFISSNNQSRTAIREKDKKIDSVTKQNQMLTEQYETLYKQKNGTANEPLVNAANTLFGSIFNYDTGKDTIKDRREKAGRFTTEQALESIFPKEATTYDASVQTVSKMKGDPQIYFEPSNDKTQNVLVIVENSIIIAGSDPQEAKFMYQLAYDPAKNRFVAIKNLGTLNE